MSKETKKPTTVLEDVENVPTHYRVIKVLCAVICAGLTAQICSREADDGAAVVTQAMGIAHKT